MNTKIHIDLLALKLENFQVQILIILITTLHINIEATDNTEKKTNLLMYHDIHNAKSKEPSKSAKDVTFWQGLGKFTLWSLGISFVVAFGAGFLGLAEDEKLDIRNMAARIMDDKKLAEKLNAELIKMAPVLKSMIQFISAKSENLGEKLLNGELSDKDAEIIAVYMDEYLRSHPKDAKKFLAVLDTAQLPQNVIDRYIAEYVSGTVSFNMAQEVKRNRKYGYQY